MYAGLWAWSTHCRLQRNEVVQINSKPIARSSRRALV